MFLNFRKRRNEHNERIFCAYRQYGNCIRDDGRDKKPCWFALPLEQHVCFLSCLISKKQRIYGISKRVKAETTMKDGFVGVAVSSSIVPGTM